MGVVVNTCLEVGEQLRVLFSLFVIDAEHGLVALDGHTCDKQGYADKGHIVHELIGLDARVGLGLEEIKVHAAACMVLCRGQPSLCH